MSSSESDVLSSPAIAMVATSSTRLPDAAPILEGASGKPSLISKWLGKLTGKSVPASPSVDWEGENLIFPCGDAQVAVSLMPAPIPWSQLEGPCATAMLWPDATEAMKQHTNFFLVAILGGSMDPVERRVLLTRIVSKVVANTDCVGVYWGDGTLVHAPDTFLEFAPKARADDIPGPLWLDVRVEPNPDGSWRCFTTGMAPLGFAEIEVQSSSLDPGDLLEFIGDTACYIVNTRQHIPEGNTMGRTPTQQFQVRYGESMFDRSQVMQLVMQ